MKKSQPKGASVIPRALPAPGDLLAIALPDGFWGAGWVVRRGAPGDQLDHLGDFVIVAAADWFARERPSIEQLRAPKLLHIDYDGYDLPGLFNVNEPIVPGVELAGRVASPPSVGKAPWVTQWARVQWVLDHQRRWNIDRVASTVAYQKQTLAWVEKNACLAADEATRTAARRASLTLAKLRKTKLVAAWSGNTPAARVREARAMLRTLLDSLEVKSPRSRRAALRACVRAFNRWNDEHGFIETAERESLHEQLCDIGAAAGLNDAHDIIESVRDW